MGDHQGHRKEAERLLAERVREISRGAYRGPPERVSFEDVAQAFLKDAEANVRDTTFKDYHGNLNRHLLRGLRLEGAGHSAG